MSPSSSQGPLSVVNRSVSPLAMLAIAIALSLGIFANQPGSPLALLPLVAYAALQILPRLGERADQRIFLGFIVLCFFVDDISQVSWGRDVDTFTEQLGIILFQSFGLTGMEYFAIAFSLFLWIARPPRQRAMWMQMGLKSVLGVGIAIFIASIIAGLYGLSSGATVQTLFIQIRFLHIMVFWTFVGFVIFRDREFAAQFLFVLTILVIMKSMQALFVYATNREIFKEAEYLIDHYFSAFSIMALVALARYAYRCRSLPLLLGQLLAALIVMAAYILNDRRTSYVGAGLAASLVPFLMPRGWLRQRLPVFAALGLLGALYVGGTWNLPAPIGFVGATIRSFGQETGSEGPSYRDLENANLMKAFADNPLTGLGYGREFTEVFKMPDISFVYDRYRMLPHNLFLASWAFGGPLTIAATSLVFISMIWLSGRLMREGQDATLWFFGLVSLFYALQYFSYTFGDIGLQINRNQMMGGLLLGGCYRLLASTVPENKL